MQAQLNLLSEQAKPTHFSLQMADKANGEEIKFLKVMKNATGEVKVFYTKTRIFLVTLDKHDNQVGFEVRLRQSLTSLLGMSTDKSLAH